MNPDRIDEEPTPTLSGLLARTIRNLNLDLRVSAPARVVTYDPAQQRAHVLLELLPVAIIEGEEVPQPPIPIPAIPVQWLGGSAGYVTTPLLPGDTGIVVFSDRSLSMWLLSGGPIDPVNGRCHNLADAVFIPGVRNTTNPITPPTSLAATVVEGPLVHLGPAATSPAVLGTQLVAAFTAWTSAVATAGAAVASPGVPDPTGALYTAYALAITTATATLAATLTSWLSTHVMVQP